MCPIAGRGDTRCRPLCGGTTHGAQYDGALGLAAKLLHWLGALIILLLLAHGWWMTHMAPRPERLSHYAGHSALGFDFLVLLVLRLLWRWFNPVPALPSDSRTWERWPAHGAHWAFYLPMFVVSLTGWVTANTFRTPVSSDGIIAMQIPAVGRNCCDRLDERSANS
jgi:cytochrome b561